VPDPLPPGRTLLDGWHATLAAALAQLRVTQEATLLHPREVGRARLPTNVLGLLFHTAEHAARHAGQVVTTMKLVQARPLGTD
jgi:uncharacterized damage-inducible protein DinB